MEDTRFNCPKCNKETENYISEKNNFGLTYYCHCNECGEDWITFSL